jgi:3-phenylpropionate/trans-cinnamate dioxygenase ferredoxin reductase subunit
VLRGDPDSRSFSCVYLADERIIALDAVNNPKDFLQAKKLFADKTTMNLDMLSDVRTELKNLVS